MFEEWYRAEVIKPADFYLVSIYNKILCQVKKATRNHL